MEAVKKNLALLVEDEPGVAQLLKSRLEGEGLEVLAVASAEAAEAALAGACPDLIVLDYSLPGKNGEEFLKWLAAEARRRGCAELPPVVITTGRGDERLAVELMKLGACDYLVKDGEFLGRVVPVAKRALQEGALRRELREQENRFKEVFELSNVAKSITLPSGSVSPNKALCDMLGYTAEELAGKNWREITAPEDVPVTEAALAALYSGERDEARFEKRYLRKDGGAVWGDVSSRVKRGPGGRVEYFITSIVDVTARKRFEEELAAVAAERRLLADTIAASLNEIYIFDDETLRFKFVNAEALRNLGYSMREAGELTPLDLKPDFSREEFSALIAPLREGKTRISAFVTRHRRRDGTLYPVEVRLQHMPENRVFLAVINDITERQRTEAALKQQSDLLRLAGRAASFGGWRVEKGKDKAVWTDETALLHDMPAGYSPSVGEAINYYAPECRPAIAEAVRACLEEGRPFDLELQMVSAKGRRFWGRAVGHAERGPDGNIISIMGSFQDINERKEMQLGLEKALAEAERFGDALDQIPVYVYIKGRDHKYSYGNRCVLELFGCGEEELKGKGDEDFFPPDTAAELRAIDDKVLSGEESRREVTVRDPERGERTYLEYKVPMYADKERTAVEGLMGVSSDITDLRRAEREALEREEMFRSMFEDHSAVKLLVEPESGEIVSANQAAVDYYGWPKAELTGKRMTDINVLPLDAIKEKLAGIRAGAGGRFEFRHRLADGRVRDVEAFVGKIRVGGRVLLHSIIHDITDRLAAEKDNRRLAAAIEQAAEAVVISDARGDILYVNPAFERVTGYGRAEVLGKNPRMFKSGVQSEIFYKEMWNRLSSGRQWSGRMVNRRKDGTLFTEETVISPVKDAQGQISNYVAVKRDVTERLALEERLRQAQKMESLGLLAGGVAHDFNNLLTGITGYAGMLRKAMPPGDPKLADLQEILYAAERAGELTKQLLIFSRKEVVNPVPMDINEGVRSALKLVGRVIGEDIRLETRLAPAACVTRMDPGHFAQVLMNLAVNARDAMPAGGTLTICTEAGRVPPGAPCAEPMLLLEVADTGCGMSPEVLGRAFEPFFTTKERGKGTGLGLPTVYRIVEQAGGEVRVTSEPDKGTTFSIYLPKAKLAAAERALPAEEIRPAGGRGELVLLVEDEERLRLLGQRMLEAGGFKVVSAANGREALEKAGAQGRPLDIVISDLVLPGMNGRELAIELSRRGLAARFLYVSGYTDELIGRHGVLEEGVAFLSKPFTPYSLTAKVRAVLDGPPEKARP